MVVEYDVEKFEEDIEKAARYGPDYMANLIAKKKGKVAANSWLDLFYRNRY
ncbi:MAG: hypothetical protein QXU74_03145 [Candidatus Aenigmatarchaeota archaeon]